MIFCNLDKFISSQCLTYYDQHEVHNGFIVAALLPSRGHS